MHYKQRKLSLNANLRRFTIAMAISFVAIMAVFGTFKGAEAVGRHYFGQNTTTSYVEKSTLDEQLAHNNHSPASKGGSFIPDAKINTNDVVGQKVNVVN